MKLISPFVTGDPFHQLIEYHCVGCVVDAVRNSRTTLTIKS